MSIDVWFGVGLVVVCGLDVKRTENRSLFWGCESVLSRVFVGDLQREKKREKAEGDHLFIPLGKKVRRVRTQASDCCFY